MVVVGAAAVVVTIFRICSPADLAVVTAVDATVVAAVVAAPNTLPECLRVCLRMTSGKQICYYLFIITNTLLRKEILNFIWDSESILTKSKQLTPKYAFPGDSQRIPYVVVCDLL